MATYGIQQQIFSRFLGIREVNGINSNGMLSAIKANNVEFYQSENTNCVGIKTQKGRKIYFSLPEDYTCLKCWKSEQKVSEDEDSKTFIFVYAENDKQGTLYALAPNALAPNVIIPKLTKTGQCNAITMSSSAYDIFIFTNGVEQKAISYGKEHDGGNLVETINAVDNQDRPIKWLAMAEWKGFLVVASKYGVHASHQNDIFIWNDNPETQADSWHIDYTSTVTAVVASQSGLFIFTNKNVDYLNTTPNDTTNAYKANASFNGTLSHSSFCIHDKFLFFYDPVQKNIYYFYVNDSNQIQLSEPVALEVQSHFNNVKTIEMTSAIYGGFNQIWILINGEEVLIFDYLNKEWITRKAQIVNGITYMDNKVLVACGNSIMQENFDYNFNGEFYPAEFKTTFINCESNTNLKKEKTPILLVLNDKNVNNFYVELSVNGKLKAPKHFKLIPKGRGVYAGDETGILTPNEQKYGYATYSADDAYSKRVVEVSTPQTWYNLGIRIFTAKEGQAFCIDSIEIKNLKAKTKTKGR